MAIFFALVGVFVIALVADRLQHKRSQVATQSNNVGKFHSASKLIPHALTMLVMVAHASEITRVVQHVSVVHIITALGLFAVWAVSSSGSEGV